MKNLKFTSYILFIILWGYLAICIHNDILIPYPFEVLKSVIDILKNNISYGYILITLKRVIEGVSLSLVLSLVLALFGSRYKIIYDLFEPLYKVIRSVPNISFIIMALIWLGSNKSVWLICFLILFPIFYSSFIMAINNEDKDLKDVAKLNDASFILNVRYHLIPMLKPVIAETLKTAVPMAIKVCVMAEIVTQAKFGIGKQLYLAKMNLETTELFGWTIIIICLCILSDYLFDKLILRYKD